MNKTVSLLAAISAIAFSSAAFAEGYVKAGIIPHNRDLVLNRQVAAPVAPAADAMNNKAIAEHKARNAKKAKKKHAAKKAAVNDMKTTTSTETKTVTGKTVEHKTTTPAVK